MKFNKFAVFICSLLFSNIIMLFLTFFYTKYTRNVLFFDAFCIAFVSIIPILIIWLKCNKDFFENFLVIFSILLFNSLFIYLGPITIDRSLSSFLYFYSVQKGHIDSDSIYDETYFKPYVKRRIIDGEKIGFLKCNNNMCAPTKKTIFIYHILYPLGKISHTLESYKDFKKYMIQKSDKLQN